MHVLAYTQNARPRAQNRDASSGYPKRKQIELAEAIGEGERRPLSCRTLWTRIKGDKEEREKVDARRSLTPMSHVGEISTSITQHKDIYVYTCILVGIRHAYMQQITCKRTRIKRPSLIPAA